jgi:hypothetical protein
MRATSRLSNSSRPGMQRFEMDVRDEEDDEVDLHAAATHSSTSRPMKAEIDYERDLFPFSIVWTPIHPITWFAPFVGHMGICDSRGVIRDWMGGGEPSQGSMGFGRPTRHVARGAASSRHCALMPSLRTQRALTHKFNREPPPRHADCCPPAAYAAPPTAPACCAACCPPCCACVPRSVCYPPCRACVPRCVRPSLLHLRAVQVPPARPSQRALRGDRAGRGARRAGQRARRRARVGRRRRRCLRRGESSCVGVCFLSCVRAARAPPGSRRTRGRGPTRGLCRRVRCRRRRETTRKRAPRQCENAPRDDAKE